MFNNKVWILTLLFATLVTSFPQNDKQESDLNNDFDNPNINAVVPNVESDSVSTEIPDSQTTIQPIVVPEPVITTAKPVVVLKPRAHRPPVASNDDEYDDEDLFIFGGRRGIFFPITFGGGVFTSRGRGSGGGVTAIANSFSRGNGGSATSYATAVDGKRPSQMAIKTPIQNNGYVYNKPDTKYEPF